ncbi:MAG TPA: aminomethyl-transferring glycine dehydrogenase [Verrucomicrobiales bacterium]|nr:aminomethyl-transferring glycine dehydrogenase [Verrucomicrobiales bacterium]
MEATDDFPRRHLGSGPADIAAMLSQLGLPSLDALIEAVVPESILLRSPLQLPAALGEREAVARLREIMAANVRRRCFLGQGFAASVMPAVIQRNVLENPGWYTAYTPYQAEVAQGRLEMLLNFQTLVTSLTGLEVANASLLDEATAAAEAMHMALGTHPCGRTFLVSNTCFGHTIDVVRTRAAPLGLRVALVDHESLAWDEWENPFGILVQYPAEDGVVHDFRPVMDEAARRGLTRIAACDPLALVLLRSPAGFGAEIAIGSMQRFGLPLGMGGPHAAFLACSDAWKRRIPGRLVGVSRDSAGRPAFRLALQTREQHIRRDKATSNICTSQVLLAVLAAAYAMYHGPEGLRRIARRVHAMAKALSESLRGLPWVEEAQAPGFDTVVAGVAEGRREMILERAEKRGILLHTRDDGRIGVTLNEAARDEDLRELVWVFGGAPEAVATPAPEEEFAPAHRRTTPLLEEAVFHRYQTETEMMRYLRRLEGRDLALNVSMIPLGSCTMKLNAASQMLALSWPEVMEMHPFAPASQIQGYLRLFEELERWLAVITGFDAVSLQPNAGSQGEYAGLLAIRGYHRSRGEERRNICLIPVSAHGTNPASAVMAGFRVMPVACDREGNIDAADLAAKAEAHAGELAALMVTYPSTHGVFEEGIRELCTLAHRYGGQVYLDGANMNAQVGLCRPADYGADVCHLNLHKTFCIPHGGGGPGVGPIAARAHLAPYLPGHRRFGGSRATGAVCSAPWGSASILTISWTYIAMMGAEGLREATRLAILNANYVARRLEPYFPVLYRGERGWVAHECIIDLRPFRDSAGIEVEDVAKRLMDYGYHSPTMSWPVAGTLMIEPTESESKEELDRFCEAMIAIHGEIVEVASGAADRKDNLLKRAPHTAEALCAEVWERPYSRERAAFPVRWVRENKVWPAVGRIDNAHGDRHLICTCEGVSAYAAGAEAGY